jgi:hypothetical protein
VNAFQDRINDARKYSADIAAKVRKGRKRWAGRSYQGGRRPFGYRPDPDAAEHRRRLVAVPAEAAVIRDAATAILDRRESLKSVAARLRAGTVPTVTGAPWTASALKGILCKPAVAGKAVHNGTLTDTAAWEPILPPDVWERLCDTLAPGQVRTVVCKDGKERTLPASTAAHGNAPKWPGSGIYRCGVCGDGTTVKVSGGAGRSRGYTCKAANHLRRVAIPVDEFVSAVVVAYLSRPDHADVLPKPAVRPGADVAALRRQVKHWEAKRAELGRLFALDVLDAAGVAEGRKIADAALARLGAELAAATETDPIPELRGPDAAAVWAGLPLERKRAVLPLLMTVTLLPAHRGSPFDPATVRVEPAA